MTTGERMRARRKELGFSADYVAEKLNVNRSTVFRYEGGDIDKLPIDILEPLSEILQTTPAYLMGWDSNAESISPAITKHEQIMLDKYRKLDDIGRYTVDTTLEAQYKRCTEPKIDLIAAHSDDYSEEQQELMLQDLEELEKLHKKRTNQ
ncbi:helix-turn-helix domain-containing protein [Paenibacillus montaniterrae]|uniref:helix-turn-helix domain-containing protein n=1 Tax=Paenibacillus montaniterrae TaxID=429341 RepID=UPI001BCEFF86|nr:helix-turn-helix transcriptional regulator [Paenibacillus montaniterrae]